MEIEPAFGLVRQTFALDPERDEHTDQNDSRTHPENRFKERGLVAEYKEDADDHKITDQIPDLVNGILPAERRTALAFFGILQCQGVAHTQLHVLPQRKDKNRHDDQHFGRRNHSLHRHAGQHDHRADLVQLRGGSRVKNSEHQNDPEPRQLPEKLGNTLVKLRHARHFCQVIVDDAFVQTKRQGKGHDRREQCPVT